MAKQTFTAGQVLTATQMNNLQANDYNWTTSAQTSSYVLVAANAGQTVTMTNASATTITVNTGLFTAGDTVRIINLGAGTCTITAGTATVSSAGSLALVQNQAGTLWFSSASAAIFIPDDKTVGAGLTLISATTIGSAVSTVTVSNAFSATYDNYKITISGGVTSVTTTDIRMTLGATATGYYQASWYGQMSAAGNGLGNGANVGYFTVGRGTTQNISANVELFNPFLSKETWENHQYLGVNTGDYVYQGSGFLNNTTSYTAFTLVPAGGTMTGGIIRVYGYQNS